MKVYLITGGAGFIGSNFIHHLYQTGEDIEVINIDKLTYAGNLKNLREVENQPGYTFIQEDICEKEKMAGIFRAFRPDYVVNFAAESHVDRSIRDSEPFVRTNVVGTQVLLEVALSCQVGKFLQVSTDEVYGSLDEVNDALGLPFTEESPLQPGNPYAASKAAADLLARSYWLTHGLPVTIARCTNNYGPRQHREKLIPLVIKNCLEGKEIPLYGDGAYSRDWIYVVDHCRALLSILHRGRPGEVYNIGAGNEWKNNDLAVLIITRLRKILKPGDIRRKKLTADLIRHVEDRKGHDRRYAVNAGKLRDELGWTPLQGFEEGLDRTIRWYMENEGWFKTEVE